MEEKNSKIALLEKPTEIKTQTSTVIQKQVEITNQAKSMQTLKVNLAELKQKSEQLKSQQQKTSTRVVEKKDINFFGGYSAQLQTQTEIEPIQEVQAIDNSSVIETPNYDFIEPLNEQQQEKIFKIEKEKKEKKQASPLLKKLKIIVFSLLFAVLGSWTIYNAVELSNVVTEYNLKLDQYLTKLGSLDSASGLNDLFPTYPEEEQDATSIGKKSNWFDRLCNFIAGIFGG